MKKETASFSSQASELVKLFLIALSEFGLADSFPATVFWSISVQHPLKPNRLNIPGFPEKRVETSPLKKVPPSRPNRVWEQRDHNIQQ